MNSVTEQALEKLFKLGDKLTTGERATTLLLNARSFPPYLKVKDASVLDDIHAVFANAVQFGAVTIDWVKFQEGNQIERIRLADLDKLAQFINRQTLATRISNAHKTMDSNTAQIAPWLKAVYDDIFSKWREGKKPFNLNPEDVDLMHDIAALVDYLESGKNMLDMRTVSVRLYHDTKHIENRLLGRLTSIYRGYLDKAAASDEEILADISLTKYPWPILIHADLDIIPYEGEHIYCGTKPHIGVPPDAICDIKLRAEPPYILTIENFSTFNTYTRLINDGGIIIYTNGFPSKWLATFYMDILSHISSSVPTYHWGDIDVGGFRILAKLQEYANEYGAIVHPHLMSPEPGMKGKPLKDSERNELSRLGDINSLANQIVRSLQTPRSIKVEQESIKPASPIGV